MALWLCALLIIPVLSGCAHSKVMPEDSQLAGNELGGEGAPDQLKETQANVTKAFEVQF